jgi:hypothetical protein
MTYIRLSYNHIMLNITLEAFPTNPLPAQHFVQAHHHAPLTCNDPASTRLPKNLFANAGKRSKRR